jgi:hypothetical protein
MARTDRNQAQDRHSQLRARALRKATVVHDGSAFQLAAELRVYGFDVAEGPLLASSERMQDWTRQLCWNGATLLAVGAAVGPVAEFFGTRRTTSSDERASGRLANIGCTKEGLFAGLPEKFRLALPAVGGFPASELSAEFRATAQTRDGDLIGASHVFRPVHLLHAGAMESGELRAVVLKNLLRLLRDNGGRAC